MQRLYHTLRGKVKNQQPCCQISFNHFTNRKGKPMKIIGINMKQELIGNQQQMTRRYWTKPNHLVPVFCQRLPRSNADWR
mgnify:CR=1 FL=1